MSRWRMNTRLRRRSISASARNTASARLRSRWRKASCTSPSIFSSREAISVRSRMSCSSTRLPTAEARLLQLSSRSPMRSRPIMNFRQASSPLAFSSVTFVMTEVTPWSISRSRVSSSFSRWRTPSNKEVTPVAMPSATMPAAIRATWQACSVCSSRCAHISSGLGMDFQPSSWSSTPSVMAIDMARESADLAFQSQVCHRNPATHPLTATSRAAR